MNGQRDGAVTYLSQPCTLVSQTSYWIITLHGIYVKVPENLFVLMYMC